MKKIKRLFALTTGLFMTLCIPTAVAQNESAPVVNHLKIRALSDGKQILLRWAPATPEAWSAGRRHGYRLERYTVSGASGFLVQPEKKILGGRVLLPAPLPAWENAVKASNYAAVIAQAFYGENFELTSASPGDLASIINQAQELEQRFATSVFMAEYDFEAAKLAAWAWADTEARPHEKYLYRIILNRPAPLAGDTAAVFIGTDEVRALPKPASVMATFGDRTALLNWNYTLLASDYHSYLVERSADNNRNFRQITDLPVTPFSPQSPEMFYRDSLPDNEHTYYYRIYGINSFGQKGPCSDTVQGKGVEKVDCQPAIIYGYFPMQNMATVGWELNCVDTGKIDSLTILQSTKVDGRFQPVAGNISPALTKYTFPLTDETNYVQLCVRFHNGTSQCSFPYMIRQIDSIPPAVPQGLQVEIDSAGVAHLSWQANTEKDFMGYRVLRSFYEKEEKSVVTPQFIHTNSFTDTLSTQTINLKVYYQVTALDHRYNESAPCEAVMALKPDNIPLIEPVFKFYEVEKGCISLSWITDPNDDATYYLFRKQYRDTVPETFIFKSDHRISEYRDCPPETGTYEYKLMATDSAHHVAFSPKPAVAFIGVEKAALKVSGLSAFRDAESKYIELSWQRHPKARAYRIYKNEMGQPLSLLKETDASVTKYVDEIVSPATDYQYTILIVPEKPERCATQSIIVKY